MKIKSLKSGILVFTFMNLFLVVNAQFSFVINGEDMTPKMSQIGELTSFDGLLYFSAYNSVDGSQLYRTDGTKKGTFILKKVSNIGLYQSGSYANKLTVVNDLMFFSAYDSTTIKKLWVTNGTEAGTRIVKHFITNNWMGMFHPIAFDDKLYFTLDTYGYGRELWQSDGTEQGTSLVKDINQGQNDSSPLCFMIFNNELYFFADDGINGNSLWKTDGTESGTLLVKKNLNPKSINPGIVYQNHLIISADDGIHGSELWKTDGTPSGTTLVKDINVGNNSSVPSSFVRYKDLIYFVASDTSDSGILPHYNKELFRTDGTNSGTYMVLDINKDEFKSSLDRIVVCNNYLFFITNINERDELWISDGSANGTQVFQNTNSSSGVYSPSRYLSINKNRMLFWNKTEFWMTDGNTYNTELLGIYDKQEYGNNPSNLIIVDTVLYFTSDNGLNLCKIGGIQTDLTFDKEYKIFVYPVPFSDNLYIHSHPYCSKVMNVEVYNQLGHCVFINEYKGVGTMKIENLDYLETGFYFLKTTINGESTTHKIIKLK